MNVRLTRNHKLGPGVQLLGFLLSLWGVTDFVCWATLGTGILSPYFWAVPTILGIWMQSGYGIRYKSSRRR